MTKVYRRGDTYIAPRGAFFDGNVKIDGDFIVPPDTHIWGWLKVGGRLELGPLSTVGGRVESRSAVIGRDVRLKGPLVVEEDVVICDNARLKSVTAGGNITLRQGVRVGDVTSSGTIYVHGKIKSDRLVGRAVKVYTV
ncbi:MAG: polymer-forming cytoskeletal protein [Methanomicrobiaceae archaeon]|nr:polymer-forming cytoskeletal protein [Methanomicrobiaceae archaeon]MDD5420335.1 polymer-forming cytoskeletal protein [Methanomicrobiaceae archaeon]